MRTKSALINGRTLQWESLVCGLVFIVIALFVFGIVRMAGAASPASIDEFDKTFNCGWKAYCDLSGYDGFRGKSTAELVRSTEDNCNGFGLGGCSEIGAIGGDCMANVIPPNIAGADFSDTTLDGLRMCRKANASGIKFTRANIKYSALLEHINLSGADFSGARVRRTSFNSSDLRGAKFKNTLFVYSVIFALANLQGADFTGAKFDPETDAKTMFEPASFYKADLSGATWVNGQKCKEGSIGVCKTDKGDIKPESINPSYKDFSVKPTPAKTGKKTKAK